MQIRRKQLKAIFSQRKREEGQEALARQKDLKSILTIGLSIAAFCLSLLSFYTTGLRVVDDLRVVVGTMPTPEPDFDEKVFLVEPEAARYVFINAGSRSAIINGMQLVLVQPEEKTSLPAS